MFATRATARISLRSSALRRPIHSAARGDWNRSSAGTIGLVVAAGAGAIGTYVSYKSGGNKNTTHVQKYPEARQPPATKSVPEQASKPPTKKSQEATSVDSQAPVKSSPSEPGIIIPPKEDPAPKKEGESTPEGGMDDLEADAANQGAFNPETGEINWDCPCLGGMAHGPCGPQFREAFSCFVYSKEEPKGVDCVEKFKAMQDCFREHPDVYGEGMFGRRRTVVCIYSYFSCLELEDDDEAPDATREPKEPNAEEDTSQKPAGEEGNPKAKVAEDDGAPAPPNPTPESRSKAPTAHATAGNTPSKRADKD